MVIVAGRPCSTKGRERNRITRAELYERARVLGVPIWDAPRRKLRRMDEICPDVHMKCRRPLSKTVGPPQAPPDGFDFGFGDYVKSARDVMKRYAAAQTEVGAVADRMRRMIGL